MITLSIIIIAAALILFVVGLFITGAIFSALFWVFVKIPVGVLCMVFGAVLCCTIILIPIGIKCIGFGFCLIVPGI